MIPLSNNRPTFYLRLKKQNLCSLWKLFLDFALIPHLKKGYGNLTERISLSKGPMVFVI